MLAFLPANAFAGAVRYAVADCFEYALNCHCSNCRRTTGSAFKPFAGIARDKLGITSGDDDLMIYGDEAGHDAHCRRCGSLLYSVVRKGAFVHVAMGTLVDAPSIRPTRPYLRGLQGALVLDHRRSAAASGRIMAGNRRNARLEVEANVRGGAVWPTNR